MRPFAYVRTDDLSDAVRRGSQGGAKYIAGGTNLLDLMKEDIEKPAELVDINRLAFDRIEQIEGGGLRIGALVRNTDAAYDGRVMSLYPLLSSAILSGASVQIRNAASMGGNLLQRTRCAYFYDGAEPCNKRRPGEGCSAIGGFNRMHAILGASEHCIATHPSDMAVALRALDAQVQVAGVNGQRTIDISDFYRLPNDTPHIETNLAQGELITAVDLPAETFDRHYTYLKIRDRLSFAFALVSVAAALRIENDRITDARIALGGVAHKPWRDRAAELAVQGERPDERTFAEAARILLRDARGQGENDFKIPLAERAVIRALKQASAGSPQPQTVKRII
jgi:xanthine dehydrogenase YagS FAD-binding subunit